LASALARRRGRIGRALAEEINRSRGMRAVHDAIVRFEPEVRGAIESLAAWAPEGAGYLEYVLRMSRTTAFRLAVVEALRPVGIVVFGDDGWLRSGAVDTDRFAGLVSPDEVARVYQGSRVNLSVSFMQASSAVHPKVFDICACGGQVLCDDCPELADAFPDNATRPATFRSIDQAVEIARELIDVDAPERRTHAAEHVRAHHSLAARARTLAVDWGLALAAR
jgi:spore maturation protein CgeB